MIKRLYKLGYGKEDVFHLFEFIDWIMALPKELEQGLWQEIHKMEEEKMMEYVSSVEKIGIQKGMQKGMRQGIHEGALKLLARQIARRFQVSFDSVQPIFAGMSTEQLEELGERFIEAQNLDQIRKWADEMRQKQLR
ncbi:MAG: DUF4351 domain-containing protein [Proteobacteria bacterium]|nr:DUF4351 domain-containing protein [Pseudomonadota bacterium]